MYEASFIKEAIAIKVEVGEILELRSRLNLAVSQIIKWETNFRILTSSRNRVSTTMKSARGSNYAYRYR